MTARGITTFHIGAEIGLPIPEIGGRIYNAPHNYLPHFTMPLITLVNASRSYNMTQGTVHAIDRVYLTIEAGDYLALTGPSGSGKSTLLNILAMLDTATGGEHRWRDTPISGASEAQRHQARIGQIGYIFQRCHLIERYTVAENIALALSGAVLLAAERQQRITALLARFGLEDHASHRPSQLSLGQQQCVAICRAVIADPPLVLADEPTAHLDAHQTAQTMRLLSTLHRAGTTVVLASQDAIVAAHAPRTLQLDAGRIIADARHRD